MTRRRRAAARRPDRTIEALRGPLPERERWQHKICQCGPVPAGGARLAAILAAHCSAIADKLAELEWAADTSDPRRLIQDRERVRPRVELFIDSLVAGLADGDWSLFANAIAAPTGEVLRSGQRSAQQLNKRARVIISVLIPLVSGVEDHDHLLVELFRTMQCLMAA
jgi:hypothetical protein